MHDNFVFYSELMNKILKNNKHKKDFFNDINRMKKYAYIFNFNSRKVNSPLKLEFLYKNYEKSNSDFFNGIDNKAITYIQFSQNLDTRKVLFNPNLTNVKNWLIKRFQNLTIQKIRNIQLLYIIKKMIEKYRNDI